MVVRERLTSTLCNCATSPLKNSAHFSLRYILSRYLSDFNPISISNLCIHQQARGWKAIALPLDYMVAEFVMLLATISHKYASQ